MCFHPQRRLDALAARTGRDADVLHRAIWASGFDVSRGMVEYARKVCRDLQHVSIRQIDGSDLSPFPDASQHLVIACDVFPYSVQIGKPSALTMLRECWRILRPGGTIAIVPWSYAGDTSDWLEAETVVDTQIA